MKENKSPLHAYSTTGDAKYQEESIRQQIAQQDAIIETATRIIEKAKSDQLVASKAKEFFLQQLPHDSRDKSYALPVRSSGRDNLEDEFIQVLSMASNKEAGLDFNEIIKTLPRKVSRGTIFRTLNNLMKEGLIRQVDPNSKRNRRFTVV